MSYREREHEHELKGSRSHGAMLAFLYEISFLRVSFLRVSFLRVNFLRVNVLRYQNGGRRIEKVNNVHLYSFVSLYVCHT